ncbi:MAG: T9SS type A sorting domain-containing protein [Calditrichaceae bacterium]
MKNDLITISTVPDIGARIMEYNLNEHPSIYVNESEFGNTYTPSSSGFFYPNFGGFKNWPAPQAEWNGGNWPPPPTLDYGHYEAVADTSIDSVSLTLTSPIEQWRAPDIQFQRRTTLYKNTSRVKVEQTIINTGSSEQQWSVWDITQSITQHGTSADYDNFWVYFPINPESQYGESGVSTGGESNAWAGEVAPGIYGVKYRPDQLKLFADPHIGWICYVDELEGYTYAKTFQIFEGADYPDDGARIAVWVQNSPKYMEVEVMSPIVDLPADSGSYTFTEDWWAAKVDGPIIAVSNAGAVKSFQYDFDTNHFTGEFGVFHIAEARLVFTDSLGSIIDSSAAYDVSPLETFVLDDSTTVPETADSVHVILFDNEDKKIGILISESVKDLTTNIINSKPTHNQGFNLEQNFPNPFNPKTTIRYTIGQQSEVSLKIYNIKGQLIKTMVDKMQEPNTYAITFNGSKFSSGIYFYNLQAESSNICKSMLLLK